MKKGFNLAANIIAIVLMGIMIVGAIILLGTLSELSSYGYDYNYSLAVGPLMGITVGLLLFCIATVIISALAIYKGNHGDAVGLKVAVIVLIGIVAVLEFIGGGVVYGVLCLIPIGFEIASLCVKNAPAQQTSATANTTHVEPAKPAETAAPKASSVDEKIAELKHMKELHVIDDEQYDKAVKALIEEIK